ncbi:hypothetical protein BGZ68_007294 [Mortierella alpina]|nr:hypothetical protein BGZ68_007294 [Mortierella alpina]
MAAARFAKDLFEPVELRLEGGEKMYGLLLAGGAKRLVDGSVAYVRPLKHRIDDEIEDLELKLALKAHAFSLLVDVENYEALEEGNPLCCMPFLEHNKLLAWKMVGLLIQCGDAVLLCVKVAVYGRSKSEDPFHALDLALPDGIRSFKLRKDGGKDFFNNVERQTRSQFHKEMSFVLLAAANPRFLHFCTMPVTLKTLWEFKASLAWSGIKVASFVFHQLLTCGKIVKLDVTGNLQKVKAKKIRAERVSGIIGNLNQLVEAMQDEELSPVSELSASSSWSLQEGCKVM